MEAECKLNLSGWVGGWVGGWLPSDIRANLSSAGAGAGTATRTELGKNTLRVATSFLLVHYIIIFALFKADKF